MNFDTIFDDHTGLLAQALPGYQRRDAQVQLARDIWQAFDNKGILIAEAATGAGKSVAYLVPAIIKAIETRKPALIITANKALQDQLIDKDLPMLADAFKDHLPPFDYRLIKGRSNYLCVREMMMYATGGIPWPHDVRDEGDALAAWASIDSCTGDRGDFQAPIVHDKTWRLVSVTGIDCDHTACPYFESCYAERATTLAGRAQIVVANYDLVLSKLLHSGEEFWHKFSYVVCDEVHELASIARRCLGDEISEGTIRRLATLASNRAGLHEGARQLRHAVAPFFVGVGNYAENSLASRLHAPGFVDADVLCDALVTLISDATGPCADCDTPGRCVVCYARKQTVEQSTKLAGKIREIVNQSDDQTAYWIESFGRNTPGYKICAAPYQVGQHLNQLIFSKFPSVVCVSATLASGGTFDFIRGELGLTEPTVAARTRTTKIASPFDFKKQAKFICPLGVPFPTSDNEAAFDATVAPMLENLINDVQGRTLVLFTSWRRLNFMAEYLRDRIKYPLIVQGDAPNKQLAQMFREQTDSVLLATRSFWVGLDVQGDSLSCLVIDKLPFESFDDPFIDMMKTKHPDTFYDQFYVPRAVLTLAQGAGRLIRSVNDRGVFVLLDQRIKARKYGRAFLASLPFGTFSQDLQDAGKFLRQSR